MKAAVYAGTRNVYEDMIPSIKSLLINSDVEKIYMLIEDDIFPIELPPECETINVSDQRWFLTNGVNYHSKWSYMILMRVVYARIFPDLDKILSLDNDTIILEDISELWDIDLEDCYFAAVKEPGRSEEENILYTCIGVSLHNLKLIREHNMDEKLRRSLNNTRYIYPEQDALNYVCVGHVKELPTEYGMAQCTAEVEHPKIMHFAATGGKWKNYDIVKYYRDIPFSEIRKEKRNEEDSDSSSDI